MWEHQHFGKTTFSVIFGGENRSRNGNISYSNVTAAKTLKCFVWKRINSFNLEHIRVCERSVFRNIDMRYTTRISLGTAFECKLFHINLIWMSVSLVGQSDVDGIFPGMGFILLVTESITTFIWRLYINQVAIS